MKFTSIRDKLIHLVTKILISVTVTFIILASILGMIVTQKQMTDTRNRIEANLMSKGNTLIANNSKALQGMAQDNAFLAVKELVAGTVNEDEDIIYGIYMDSHLQPWVHVTKDNPEGTVKGVQVLTDSTSQWAASLKAMAVKRLEVNGINLIEFSAPVKAKDENLGTIRYGLTTAGMEKQIKSAINEIRRNTIQFSGIMAFFILLVFFWSTRAARSQANSLTRPIHELSQSATDIISGKYLTPVKTATDDEVGDLARNFEKMRVRIKDYTENLEQKVQERTRQLDGAMIDLKRSNQELEQFAYVASHDLQEPLRMVTSYLGLIEKRYKDKLDESGHEFIDYAVDGAVRMRQLINDLLAYSRVGTRGKPFLETDLEKVFEAVTKNLEISIEENKAKITHDELPRLVADEGQLIQLFQNITGNALKFCKDRAPEIHLIAGKDGDKWKFGIKDNGIGIAPEHQERVFQIFQRLHTRDEFEGTGIGLAVCKKIVERHGGQVWVESEVGKGTTFWFTIAKLEIEEVSEELQEK